MSALSDPAVELIPKRPAGRPAERRASADIPPPLDAARRIPISAFVICRDELRMLGDCLASLALCHEIVVVDSGSTDGTLELVERFQAAGYPIVLMHRQWDGFATQKQFALEQCRGPWCLSIDADERLDRRLQERLRSIDLSDPQVDGYRLARRDFLPGYGYPPSAVSAKSILRLVRNGRASFDAGQLVHESIRLDGREAVLEGGAILHYRNITIAEEARKANEYAELKARQRHAEGQRPSMLKLFFNPLARFLSAYVMQRYLLCGRAGFIYAGILGYYTFLTEATLYRLTVSPRQDEPASTSPPAS